MHEADPLTRNRGGPPFEVLCFTRSRVTDGMVHALLVLRTIHLLCRLDLDVAVLE